MSDKITPDHTPECPTSVAQPVTTPATVLPCVDSEALFKGQRELIIAHQGEAYRLRITRHDKLILTK